MKKKSRLKKTSELHVEPSAEGVVKLLLKDHEAMRVLMKQVKSHRATPAKIYKSFELLEKLVLSHVKAEEYSLLNRIDHHPKFEDHAKESIEEHNIHENILKGIRRLRDQDRKITQMKIFCEMLKDHIDEEEEELFPQFKKYSATSTRKKMGTLFLRRREQTRLNGEHLGSMND
ncbi:MAG: hemerythrin domain-containing protein [Bdellovibrio sp.]|nr:hemerythrin domain-containing protein [Bdellovibrio sp.]